MVFKHLPEWHSGAPNYGKIIGITNGGARDVLMLDTSMGFGAMLPRDFVSKLSVLMCFNVYFYEIIIIINIDFGKICIYGMLTHIYVDPYFDWLTKN